VAIPLFDPLRDGLSALAGDVVERIETRAATIVLAGVAAALLSAAALVALTAEVGFPIDALAIAAVFGALALAAHMFGRRL
jgi:hypothetical protein